MQPDMHGSQTPISYLEPQNHSIIRPSKSGDVTEKDFHKHPLFRTVMFRNAFHPDNKQHNIIHFTNSYPS